MSATCAPVAAHGDLQRREPYPDTTGLFVASDQQATGALVAFYERGCRVPDDLAVVSLDGAPAAEFTVPPLTTIHVPVAQMAIDAIAEVLIRNGRNIEHSTDLVIRESCGCTPQR